MAARRPPGREEEKASSRLPRHRPRRLRRSPALREWVAESDPEPRRLVLPVFVRPGSGPPTPVAGFPGVSLWPIEALPKLVRGLSDDGVRAVLLFGTARRKDTSGSEARSAEGAVPRAVTSLKRLDPSLVVATDVCLCAYTSHGHCGVLRGTAVDNDRTIALLGTVAALHAHAGADLVAPSAMMDGQVGAIRAALDDAGALETAILAYSSKHASALYGPFRATEGSAPSFGDRASYQMDYRNGREALGEMELDRREGADLLMVKPALTSLDLLARARARFDLPLAAFQVSGEYAMIKAAADRGFLDERLAVRETLGAIRRAGADVIVSYYAREFARWTREGA